MDWAKLTEYDQWKYNALSDNSLSNIDIPLEAIMCGNFNCKTHKHRSDIVTMYDKIVNCLINDSK